MTHRESTSDVIIKEGYLELQTGSGIRRKFHRRYCIVKKSGIVDLYEKKEKSAKESFHVQGGEEIVLPGIYKKRFRLKIIIPEFKKAQKWCFGFESESSQKAWYNAFDSILKQMVLFLLFVCLLASISSHIYAPITLNKGFTLSPSSRTECVQCQHSKWSINDWRSFS